MATKKQPTENIQPVYTEQFAARVNRHEESRLEEVILRGVDSPHTLVLRFEGEISGIVDGKIYHLSLTEVLPSGEEATDDGQPENNQE
jgi:hypothetical protein